MADYTIKDDDPQVQSKFIKAILDEVGRGAKERESRMQLNIGRREGANAVSQRGEGAADNLWDLGTYLWEDGYKHLPTSWVTKVCPTSLNLSTVPTFNYYKALAKQVQDGVVSSAPDVEFQFDVEPGEDIGEFVDEFELAEWANEEWAKDSERSRMMAVVKRDVKYNWNYGEGWYSIKNSGSKDLRMCAVHPQLIIADPNADTYDEINWVAKVFTETLAEDQPEPTDGTKLFDFETIPETMVKKGDRKKTRLLCEVWVKKGAKIGKLRFEENGIHLVVRSDNQVQMEEPWPFTVLPVIPSVLNPGDTVTGEAMSSVLWEAQVDLDKAYAKYIAALARAGDDKYHVQISEPTEPNEGMAVGAMGPGGIGRELKDPGVQVITTNGKVELLKEGETLEKLWGAVLNAMERIGRLAGISEAYQGIEPDQATSGVAIQSLAALSSKMVQNWATNEAEGLRELGRAWVLIKLGKQGIMVDPEKINITVTLIPNEEVTRERIVDDIASLSERAGMPPPVEIMVDLMPRLSAKQKDKLKQYYSKISGQQAEAAAQSPDAGMQGQSPMEPAMAGMVSGEPMGDEGAPPDLNAPNVY